MRCIIWLKWNKHLLSLNSVPEQISCPQPLWGKLTGFPDIFSFALRVGRPFQNFHVFPAESIQNLNQTWGGGNRAVHSFIFDNQGCFLLNMLSEIINKYILQIYCMYIFFILFSENLATPGCFLWKKIVPASILLFSLGLERIFLLHVEQHQQYTKCINFFFMLKSLTLCVRCS